MKKALTKVANTNEGQAINLTVEELTEELQMLSWQEGVESLKITEEFKKSGRKEFEVESLQMELEDKIIICSDADEVIINSGSVLIGFLETSLLQIKKISNQCFELRFGDGKVVIQGN